MCLYSKSGRTYTATKPITCYKVVFIERGKGKKLKFTSEIQRFRYKIGSEYGLDARSMERSFGPADKLEKDNWTGETIVRYGFHSYKRLCDAERESAPWNMHDAVYAILKCEIPAGARYWIGNKGGAHPSAPSPHKYAEYCSEKIKVVAWRFVKENYDTLKVSRSAWTTDVSEEILSKFEFRAIRDHR